MVCSFPVLPERFVISFGNAPPAPAGPGGHKMFSLGDSHICVLGQMPPNDDRLSCNPPQVAQGSPPSERYKYITSAGDAVCALRLSNSELFCFPDMDFP